MPNAALGTLLEQHFQDLDNKDCAPEKAGQDPERSSSHTELNVIRRCPDPPHGKALLLRQLHGAQLLYLHHLVSLPRSSENQLVSQHHMREFRPYI